MYAYGTDPTKITKPDHLMPYSQQPYQTPPYATGAQQQRQAQNSQKNDQTFGAGRWAYSQAPSPQPKAPDMSVYGRAQPVQPQSYGTPYGMYAYGTTAEDIAKQPYTDHMQPNPAYSPSSARPTQPPNQGTPYGQPAQQQPAIRPPAATRFDSVLAADAPWWAGELGNLPHNPADNRPAYGPTGTATGANAGNFQPSVPANPYANMQPGVYGMDGRMIPGNMNTALNTANQQQAAMVQLLNQRNAPLSFFGNGLGIDMGPQTPDMQSMLKQAQQMVAGGWQNPMQRYFEEADATQQRALRQPPQQEAIRQPSFDRNAIQDLFTQNNIQAPQGFLDQLIGLLGGNAPQPQLPAPGLRPAPGAPDRAPPATGRSWQQIAGDFYDPDPGGIKLMVVQDWHNPQTGEEYAATGLAPRAGTGWVRGKSPQKRLAELRGELERAERGAVNPPARWDQDIRGVRVFDGDAEKFAQTAELLRRQIAELENPAGGGQYQYGRPSPRPIAPQHPPRISPTTPTSGNWIQRPDGQWEETQPKIYGGKDPVLKAPQASAGYQGPPSQKPRTLEEMAFPPGWKHGDPLPTPPEGFYWDERSNLQYSGKYDPRAYYDDAGNRANLPFMEFVPSASAEDRQKAYDDYASQRGFYKRDESGKRIGPQPGIRSAPEPRPGPGLIDWRYSPGSAQPVQPPSQGTPYRPAMPTDMNDPDQRSDARYDIEDWIEQRFNPGLIGSFNSVTSKWGRKNIGDKYTDAAYDGDTRGITKSWSAKDQRREEDRAYNEYRAAQKKAKAPALARGQWSAELAEYNSAINQIAELDPIYARDSYGVRGAALDKVLGEMQAERNRATQEGYKQQHEALVKKLAAQPRAPSPWMQQQERIANLSNRISSGATPAEMAEYSALAGPAALNYAINRAGVSYAKNIGGAMR